jgi:hypothetical protein
MWYSGSRGCNFGAFRHCLWVNNSYFACPQGIFWQYKFFWWFSAKIMTFRDLSSGGHHDTWQVLYFDMAGTHRDTWQPNQLKLYSIPFNPNSAYTVQFGIVRHPYVTVTHLTKFPFHQLALWPVTRPKSHQLWLGWQMSARLWPVLQC